MSKNIVAKALLVIIMILSTIVLLKDKPINSFKRIVETINQQNEEREVVRKGTTDEKVIAITFDDGPHPRFTPQILSILKENDAKATFFVLGKHAEWYSKALLQVKEEGHEIGNHSYGHVDIKKISEEVIISEIEKTQDIIFKLTGNKPSLFRPPFGFYNEKLLKILKERDLKVILWTETQDPLDWNHPGVDKIVKKVLSNAQSGDIILLHDYAEGECEAIKALEIILPELKKRGFRFVTVSELLSIELSGGSFK